MEALDLGVPYFWTNPDRGSGQRIRSEPWKTIFDQPSSTISSMDFRHIFRHLRILIYISWLSILKKQRTNSYSLPWSSTVGRDEAPYKYKWCEMMMWRQINKIHAKNDVSFEKKTETTSRFWFSYIAIVWPSETGSFQQQPISLAQVKVRNAKIVMKPKLESVNPFYERPPINPGSPWRSLFFVNSMWSMGMWWFCAS